MGKDKPNINFVKLMLRSHLSLYKGNDKAIRDEIAVVLKKMRYEGWTYIQIAEYFGLHLGINVQPGNARTAMRYLIEEVLFNFVVTADRRDKACANCPLRTFPFSIEIQDPTFTPKEKT